jgi:hypothetical protein
MAELAGALDKDKEEPSSLVAGSTSDTFSESELNYIYDMLNGTLLTPELSFKVFLISEIEDADKFDRLSEKWNVDIEKFLNKLNALSEFECYAVCKIAEEFWEKGK